MSEAKVQGSAAPPTDAQVALDYIRELQRNGRLLLSFLALRPDRSPGTQPHGHGEVAAFALLTTEPTAIAADREMFGTLVACVDDLSRRAAPATLSSIRTTGAYRGTQLEAAPLAGEALQRALTIRGQLKKLLWFAGGLTILVILLLVHVDDGRRAVQQLTTARAEVAAAHERLTLQAPSVWVQLPEGGERPAVAALFCPTKPDSTPLPGLHPKPNTAEGARAAILCNQRDQAALRQELVFQRVAAWNQRTRAIFLVPFGEYVCRRFYGRAPCTTPPPNADELQKHWQRTEIRATGAISLLTGFVLPLLLGCLGGLASSLRRLDQKVADWTLDAQDGRRSVVRVVLATMMGGLVGLVFTGDQPIEVQGFALSLAAAAFFIGFSIEIVFTVVEAMVEAVASKLRTQPPPPPAPADAATPGPVTKRLPTPAPPLGSAPQEAKP